MARLLVFGISFTIRVLRAAFRSRANLVIENIALRQQVTTLLKQRRRPALDNADRAFWVALRAAGLAEVDEHIGYCENGHRGKVASGSIPSPLGYDLAAAASRSTSN